MAIFYLPKRYIFPRISPKRDMMIRNYTKKVVPNVKLPHEPDFDSLPHGGVINYVLSF